MKLPFLNLWMGPYGRMARISRSKLSGIGRHEGVLLPDGSVVHTSIDGGTQVCTYEVFCAGRVVVIEHEIPPNQHQAALHVLHGLLAANTPYHLITNNCEIFSRKVLQEPAVSPQLGFWVVAGICVVAWVSSKQKLSF